MIAPPPLSLLIKPAGRDCNLACDYCFYRDRADPSGLGDSTRMSGQVLESLVRNYFGLQQPVHSFCWQGGEPTLMGTDFFRRVTSLQKQHGRPGSTVANSIQTNCTRLDLEMVDHFAQYRFLIGCSLDGPATLHDRYRRGRKGSGSHRRVLAGLNLIRSRNLAVNALTLVSSANVRHSTMVYDYLLSLGFDYLQFIPCVEFTRENELESYAITSDQWGQFLCEIFDRWITDGPGRITIRLFDAILAKLALGQDSICTLGRDCRQYLVVDHNGDVYPCDFRVEKSRKLGNVIFDSLADICGASSYRKFGAAKTPTLPICLECPHLHLCNGDCPVRRHPTLNPVADGSWLCGGWRRFFDHALPRLSELARSEVARRSDNGR